MEKYIADISFERVLRNIQKILLLITLYKQNTNETSTVSLS